MTDEELIERLEDGSIAPDSFHHLEHVRAVFLYLCRYPMLEALQRFAAALQRFAAAMGKADRYHETITWAYVFLVESGCRARKIGVFCLRESGSAQLEGFHS